MEWSWNGGLPPDRVIMPHHPGLPVPIAALHYLSAEGKRALAAFRREMNADDGLSGASNIA